MLIETYMTRAVRCVKPRESILHAREVMERHRINQLPVTVNGRLVGIVTDRDLRDAFPSVFGGRPSRVAGQDPKEIPVESVMTTNVLTLGPRDTVATAAALMRRQRVGAIPILDGDRLAGILARSDVLQAYVAREGTAAEPAASTAPGTSTLRDRA